MPSLQQRNTLFRFTSCTRCQASSEVWSTDASSLGEIPALLNSTSMPPNSWLARAYMPRTWSSSVTSAWRARSPAASGVRSTPTTFAPSSENSRAVSAPIPPAAPVITHTFPSSRTVTSAGHPAPRPDDDSWPPASRNPRRVKDALHFGVVVERMRPELASHTGLLEAAERSGHAHRGVRVDRQNAGLDRARHAQRLGAVPGPDRAGQPVDRLVGQPHRLFFRRERDDHRHRAEDLLARGAVVVGHGT